MVREYQRVVLLGDFNARVGRSTDVDDVIGSLVMCLLIVQILECLIIF